MLLGLYQLWRIALLHHPWDYLAQFETHEARALIHQRCDLLLRGHLHVPQPERIVPPDPSRGCLELPTGCVYENSQYPNAFQWIELLPDKRVRVQFRAWLHKAWTIDRNQPGCPDGYADFNFAGPVEPVKGKQKGKRQPTAAVIPAEYVAWLQRTCADEPAGPGGAEGPGDYAEPSLCAGADPAGGNA